jgi:RNA polymerase sigma-70 factor (ECF subfamily)
MPLQDLSDEDLIARYRENVQSQERELCVNELFRRNYARVARWCLRFTSNRESAADMAQEVFTRAYQNLGSFQGQSKFSSWLFTIARNHCLNTIRVNSRQATELKADVEDDFFGEIPDSSERPDAGLDREATAKQVAQVLTSALDETERVVFTLHYGDELPLDTITRMLGLENASGAKAYIVSAKRKLARWISQKKVERP